MALQLYVWDRCFLLRADTLVLARQTRARSRPAATLLVARDEPFAMEGIGEPGQRFEAMLLAPHVPRATLAAVRSDLFILDAGLATPAYQRLHPALLVDATRIFDAQDSARLRALLPPREPSLDCAQARQLFDALIDALVPDAPAPLSLDPRIEQVMRVIEQHPFDEITVPMLAASAQLSVSRLRALFQQHLGCAPAPYARWIKTWQAIRVWRKGMSFTEAAHQAGFYDLAHVDRAMKELFGMNPRAMATASGVEFHHCAR